MANPDRSLDAALVALLAEFGKAGVVRHRSVDWASATFIGARHEIGVALDVGGLPFAADAVAARLKEAELALPGHVLADMVLAGHGVQGDRILLEIEALTLVDT